MKYFRVATARGAAWAREEGDRLRLLAGPPWQEPATRAESVPLAGARLLAPVTPSKIVAIGLNYKDHAAERGRPLPAEPLIFLKPPSAVIGPDAPVRQPAWAGRVDHEAELAIVIGRVNGKVRQRSTTAEPIFGPEHLVWFVSRVMTLLPGDIICTGTPAGIGPPAAGDNVEVEVAGVGILRNPVVASGS